MGEVEGCTDDDDGDGDDDDDDDDDIIYCYRTAMPLRTSISEGRV